MEEEKLVWDRSHSSGPLRLGMSRHELETTIEGTGHYFDDDEADPDNTYFWEVDRAGLSIQLSEDVVISISSTKEFVVGESNLIGMLRDPASNVCGGILQVSDKGVIEYVYTNSGLELYIADGAVTTVVLTIEDWAVKCS